MPPRQTEGTVVVAKSFAFAMNNGYGCVCIYWWIDLVLAMDGRIGWMKRMCVYSGQEAAALQILALSSMDHMTCTSS